MQIIKKVSWQLGTNVTKCNILLTWYYYTQGIIQKRKKKKKTTIGIGTGLLTTEHYEKIHIFIFI